MRSPSFWYPPKGATPLAARLLSPLGWLYGRAAFFKQRFSAGERIGIPVICVGNVTAGGAGKTPTALFLAERLKAMGERPHFLSRGYGGTLEGPLRVNPARHSAAEVGDEPLLLAGEAPCWISADRVKGARAAEEDGASVLIMDDGFQNPSLQKDLSFLVIDGEAGLGNGKVMPAGPLRETYEAALSRAEAVIVIGAGEPGRHPAEMAERAGLAVFSARLTPGEAEAAALRGQKTVAFAGIGRPEKFFRTLEEIGADIQSRHGFPDHAPYSQKDLDGLAKEAARREAVLVTTEKDAMRCRGLSLPRLVTLPVRLDVEGEGGIDALLEEALRRARADHTYVPFAAPEGSA
jgi:tetraacyldisaccharide 4'-kinase